MLLYVQMIKFAAESLTTIIAVVRAQHSGKYSEGSQLHPVKISVPGGQLRCDEGRHTFKFKASPTGQAPGQKATE